MLPHFILFSFDKYVCFIFSYPNKYWANQNKFICQKLVKYESKKTYMID